MSKPTFRVARVVPRTVLTSWKGVYDRLGRGLCDALKNDGFQVSAEAKNNAWDALIALLRVKDRSILPKPRSVLRSRELLARTLPPPIVTALDMIERESMKGDDLNPRLTRKFFKSSFDDALLADLRVQHFHLGPRGAGPNGQAGGTSDLLFAAVTDTELLFLDVLDHGAFNSGKFVEMIVSNWPRLLGPSLPGIIPGEPASGACLDDDRAAMRKAGVSPTINVNGVLHMPPGIAMTTSGTPVLVVAKANQLIRHVADSYTWLEENADDFAEYIGQRMGHPIREFNIYPRLDDEVLTFQEQQTGAVFFPENGSCTFRLSYAQHHVPLAGQTLRSIGGSRPRTAAIRSLIDRR